MNDTGRPLIEVCASMSKSAMSYATDLNHHVVYGKCVVR